jgi:hypothetical protein
VQTDVAEELLDACSGEISVDEADTDKRKFGGKAPDRRYGRR